MSKSDPLVPEDFNLNTALYSDRSTTPKDTQPRCPDEECKSIKISKKNRSPDMRTFPEPYFCDSCGLHFEDPLPPKCEEKEEDDE